MQRVHHCTITPLTSCAYAVAAWGEHAHQQLRKQLQSVLSKKTIWLTEFNLGERDGCGGTPFPQARKHGAVAGIFWAGHVLAAIDSYGASTPLRALNYHLFSHQRACRAGARRDTACWGVNESLVHLPPRERSTRSPVHVNGAGQIFAHVNAVALRGHPGQQMRRVRPARGSSCDHHLSFDYVGEKRRWTHRDGFGRKVYMENRFPLTHEAGTSRCLLAAVFDSVTTPNASFVVLNRCTRGIRVSLRAAEMLRGRLPPGAQNWSLVATTYLADDPGALVGLPGDLHEDPFVFPWRTGPLSPTVNVNTELRHDELDQYTFILRAVSLTIASYSPAGDAPFDVPADLLPGGRWVWRRTTAANNEAWRNVIDARKRKLQHDQERISVKVATLENTLRDRLFSNVRLRAEKEKLKKVGKEIKIMDGAAREATEERCRGEAAQDFLFCNVQKMTPVAASPDTSAPASPPLAAASAPLAGSRPSEYLL